VLGRLLESSGTASSIWRAAAIPTRTRAT
jgi:hypothetical protein